MAIETQMGISEVLNSYETRNWVKGTKVDTAQHKLNNLEPNEFKPLETGNNKSFGDFLVDSMSKVNNLQKDANFAIEKLASGKTKNIHETMLAVENAHLAFKAMNQVRTKVIDAYREIMRMQI